MHGCGQLAVQVRKSRDLARPADGADGGHEVTALNSPSTHPEQAREGGQSAGGSVTPGTHTLSGGVLAFRLDCGWHLKDTCCSRTRTASAYRVRGKCGSAAAYLITHNFSHHALTFQLLP